MELQYDVIVIGGGPAGIHAAGLLAASEKKVALVEKKQLGGCCSNTGCIPTKTLIAEAKQDSFDWKEFQQKLASLNVSNREGIRLVLLSRGVHIYDGEAVFVSENQCKVTDAAGQEQIISGKYVIAATGSVPYVPEALQGFSGIQTTDTFWFMNELPRRLVILGGGVIGCEIACALAGKVSELTLVEKKTRILDGFSDRATEILTEYMEKNGVKVYTGCEIMAHSKEGEAGVLFLSEGQLVAADCLLTAAGRTPVFPNGMERVSGAYFIGDVSGGTMTAHEAKQQAENCVERLLQADFREENEPVTPTCVFTRPELAKIGLSKKQAEKLGYHAVDGKAPFFVLGMAKILGDTDGYISLCRDADTDLLLGAEIVGGNACELIHILQVYMVHKIPCKEMKKMVFAHPTYAEGIRIALDETYGGSVELPYRKKRR